MKYRRDKRRKLTQRRKDAEKEAGQEKVERSEEAEAEERLKKKERETKCPPASLSALFSSASLRGAEEKTGSRAQGSSVFLCVSASLRELVIP